MARSDQIYHRREALEKQLGFCQCVRAGDVLYFSGVVSVDEAGAVRDPGDFPAQIRNVYTELKDILVAHGITLEHVVKETVYTTDIEGMIASAGVRLELLAGAAPPASSWVEVSRLFHADLKLEVEWTAHIPERG